MATGNHTLHKNEVVYAESINLGGTAIDATAAEINAAADKSANAVIAANGDTLAVTQELHAGKVVAFGKLAGTVVTLPAATGTGDIYRFVISIAATTNANIIKVAASPGTDVMVGSMNIQADADAAGTSVVHLAGATADTMTFAGAATTGGAKGGYIECIDYLSGFWSVRAFTQSSGGSEATPFSATVP